MAYCGFTASLGVNWRAHLLWESRPFWSGTKEMECTLELVFASLFAEPRAPGRGDQLTFREAFRIASAALFPMRMQSGMPIPV
jgi:hypothetical protein